MGEFNAGKWVVLLSIYFFTFSLVVLSIGQSQSAYGTATVSASNNFENLNISDVPTDPITGDDLSWSQQILIGVFGGATGTINQNATVEDFQDSQIFTFIDSLQFMMGIENDISIGFPSNFYWIFSFIFFWIPLLMFAYAVFMMLPFMH